MIHFIKLHLMVISYSIYLYYYFINYFFIKFLILFVLLSFYFCLSLFIFCTSLSTFHPFDSHIFSMCILRGNITDISLHVSYLTSHLTCTSWSLNPFDWLPCLSQHNVMSSLSYTSPHMETVTFLPSDRDHLG